MFRKIFLAVAAVAAFAVMAMPAFAVKGGNSTGAKGGNSENAKTCQKGGWETQAPTEDPSTAFTSSDACASYGATGGTITTLKRTLAVSKAGDGSGQVTGSLARINCGTTCTADYNHGTVVTLTASKAAGSEFSGWSGACTGTSTCAVTMDAARSVTATFTNVQATQTAEQVCEGTDGEETEWEQEDGLGIQFDNSGTWDWYDGDYVATGIKFQCGGFLALEFDDPEGEPISLGGWFGGSLEDNCGFLEDNYYDCYATNPFPAELSVTEEVSAFKTLLDPYCASAGGAGQLVSTRQIEHYYGAEMRYARYFWHYVCR